MAKGGGTGQTVSFLERIVASKRAEVTTRRQVRAPARAYSPRDFAPSLQRLQGQPLRLLAEIKRRSPSAGELSSSLSIGARALAYARAGACAVSVLCDGPFFGGSYEDLDTAREALSSAGLEAPVLAKEFVLDEVQLDWAVDHGADAVLLIVRIVEAPALARLARAARERGLEPLFEVVDENELRTALACGARVVGVNARDLDTLVLDLDRAARVLARIPAECVAVHLSGVKNADAVRAIRDSRADAALIGEALMREANPTPLLRRMVEAAEGSRGA